MMTTISKYLAWRTLRGIFLAFIIVLSIIMLVDFVEGTRNNEELSTVSQITLTLLKAPRLIEQTIPFVVLFGVMGTLYGLNRRSELIVLRASGLSAWRFLLPAIAVTAILGVVWSATINPLASAAMTAHNQVLQNLAGASNNSAVSQNVWLREGDKEGQTVIFAERANPFSQTLYQVTFYKFAFDDTDNPKFQMRYDAQSARLRTPGKWTLSSVIENSPGLASKTHSSIEIATRLTADDLQDQTGNTNLPPIWAIPAAVKKTKRAGFSTTGMRMQWHKLLALPVMLVAMTIVAAAVSMHLTREGGTFRLLLVGSLLGFAVYFTDNVITAFGESAALPILVAAWTTPLLVLLTGLTYLARIEDG